MHLLWWLVTQTNLKSVVLSYNGTAQESSHLLTQILLFPKHQTPKLPGWTGGSHSTVINDVGLWRVLLKIK